MAKTFISATWLVSARSQPTSLYSRVNSATHPYGCRGRGVVGHDTSGLIERAALLWAAGVPTARTRLFGLPQRRIARKSAAEVMLPVRS